MTSGPYRCWITSGGGGGEVFRISTAHDEWNHLVIPLVAMERGLFTQEGLRHVELIATESEADQIEGLDEGWIDLAADPLTSLVLQANAAGRRVYICGGRRRGYTFLLYGGRGLQRVEDLKGKRIITTERNGVTDVQGREIVRRHGLEPDRDISFIYRASMHDVLETVEALEAGEGEAVMVPASLAPQMEGRGYPMLVDSGKFFQPRHDRVMAVSGARLERGSEALGGCLRAMMRAASVVLDRSEAESIRDLMEACGFPVRGPRDGPAFDLILEALYTRVDSTFALPIDGLVETVAECQRDGLVPADYRVEGALRLESLQAAQRSPRSEPRPSGSGD